LAEYPGDAMSYDAWKLRNLDDDRELREGRQYVEPEHCALCGSDDRICNYARCPYKTTARSVESYDRA
jgi:hypothetical protein